ncbi:hypothetical protein GLYMA_20G060500v4 [Glycine max]|uniref:Uncharacterized protein n=1 Tax=Glycine max TaxID=3847 RepID=A0A0R0E8D7_SOYBN|nr:hypothetical protein GYH30_054959 [Glycine max]KRG90000.1 hypothetical protein GLYMA_20G060500v4 [Glycine max]
MRFRWGSRFVRLGHGAGLTIAGDAETRVEEGRTQPPWCSGTCTCDYSRGESLHDHITGMEVWLRPKNLEEGFLNSWNYAAEIAKL